MKTENLSNFFRGWIVGDFSPTLNKTELFEVAVKRYSSGENEPAHYHKIATEITVIVSGRVRMNGQEYCTDDIIVIEPGEATYFEVLDDCITTVIKIPSISNDKYLVTPC